MGNRGRISSSALSVIGPGGIEATPRPKSPIELSDEQAEVWREIVNRMPADWFGPETIPLLVQYCRHVARARRFAYLLDVAEKAVDFDVDVYRDLCRSEEEQSRAIAALATKMRLSQQSSYDKSKKKIKGGAAPWQT